MGVAEVWPLPVSKDSYALDQSDRSGRPCAVSDEYPASGDRWKVRDWQTSTKLVMRVLDHVCLVPRGLRSEFN